MSSDQPISSDGGHARAPTCGLREGAATANAQKSLLQLLARIIAKAWRESHAKAREHDVAGLSIRFPEINENSAANDVQSPP